MTVPRGHRRGLRETQEWLARRILDGAPLDADAVLVTPPSGTLTARLHAYADGYPARIREALGESFPAVMHLIGQRQATALTLRYIAAHPPRSFNLNHAGDALVEFLRGDELSMSFPFLPDLADLEWRMTRAFHAEELPPIEPARLAGWDEHAWASAVLRFQPAVAAISSPWPLRDLHAARDIPLDEIDIDVRDRPDHVLVRRHGLAVHCDAIDVVEAQALRALLAGDRLGDVMQRLAEAEYDAAAISAWFARWMQLGLIVDVSIWSATEPPLRSIVAGSSPLAGGTRRGVAK